MKEEKRDFNKAAATWDEEPKRVKLASDVSAAISEEVSPGKDMDVLDFGCGTGLLTTKIQPYVRSITGVDSSKGMLDILEAKIDALGLDNVRALRLDLDKGDTLEGRYHLITSSMTLHHVRKIQPLLRQFYSVLLPSGSLCIADLDLDGGQFHEDSTGVFHDGFDRAVLRGEFEDAGFTDITDKTAARMIKPVAGGEKREFTIFLMTGRKK